MSTFGSRLSEVLARRGPLCLGIDPHAFLLAEWGLPDTPAGLREFALRAVDAAASTIGIVKPQIAFFERHGAAGYIVLEEVLATARAADLLVIADVKRGDIGSTIAAYGEAWLTPGSPLEADAMTLVPYQGLGALGDPIERAITHSKGVFVLAATSNPEAAELQTAVVQSRDTAGESVAASIVSGVVRLNSSADGMGSVGLVLGATVALSDYGITTDQLGQTPILAPGFGEQGAHLDQLGELFGAARKSVIANVGRAALRAGPDGLESELALMTGILHRQAQR
jgi:orotidine-5'-phosphate decarboxylase